jgi:hypothetical protein
MPIQEDQLGVLVVVLLRKAQVLRVHLVKDLLVVMEVLLMALVVAVAELVRWVEMVAQHLLVMLALVALV